MITLPKNITKHKQDFDVLCDWVESSILFSDNEDQISLNTVADVLTDEDIFSAQSEAYTIAADIWAALRIRQSCLDENYPFVITSTRIERKGEWDKFPAYTFCLLLSMAVWLRIKAHWQTLGGFTVDGELFEKLTEASLVRHFPDWKFEIVGWSRSNPTGLENAIKNIITNIREKEMNRFTNYLNPKSKDAGLDLIGYRTFKDSRGALPIFFLQCATGDDWNAKLNTPDLKIWAKIIDFTSTPKRGFAMPFSLLESDKEMVFRTSAIVVEGPFFDRYRLLSIADGNQESENWVPADLKTQLIEWVIPRLEHLTWDV